MLDTIHLGATAQQLPWDLKKTAGRQSLFEFTTPAKGGLLEWLRRSRMLSECEMRRWPWKAMETLPYA